MSPELSAVEALAISKNFDGVLDAKHNPAEMLIQASSGRTDHKVAGGSC